VSNPYPQPQETPAPESEPPVRRLNWGSGEHPEPGWINSDIKDGPGIDISCDIRHGLPLEDASLDYIASQHALPEIPLTDLVGVFRELRRVLKPGGILRLGLPDLDKGIKAYIEGDRDYFLIPDEDASTIGGKFVTQLLWYGWSRTLFTHDFTDELLKEAGFGEIHACSFHETKSRFPEIVNLDSRERESFFVEATK
jgi:predicted SAM-dependent methyltransferase